MTIFLLFNYILVLFFPVSVDASQFCFHIRLEKRAITFAFIKNYIYICHKVIFEVKASFLGKGIGHYKN